MKEEWRLYKDKRYKENGQRTTGSLWEVSNLGNIKRDGKIFNPHKTKFKYLKAGCTPVHRMVAETFVNNDAPNIKKHVDHIDGNRYNNKASNLRWVTQAENNQNPITRQHYRECHNGSRWMTKNKKSYYVKSELIDEYLNNGFHFGRI